jgi:hypothetical protein
MNNIIQQSTVSIETRVSKSFEGENMADQIKVPAAPEVLPEKEQAQWKQTWLKEYKQAQLDHPGDETAQRAISTRIANRALNPDDPESYEQAIALPAWQCVSRGEQNGKFFVVLINSKKFAFDVPAKVAKAAAARNGAGAKN